MKKWICFILLVITAQASAQKPTEKTLLWQITRKGLPAASYLYGTFHLMCPEDLVVNNVLREKFKATKQLYLELDMDDPSIMLQMMMNTGMKGDTTLSKLLGEKEYDSVSAIFQKAAGIPLSMLNGMKPLFSMAAVFPALLDCQANEGWEKKFMELANENKEEIKGLETVKEQLDVVDSIPYMVQAKMFSKTLLNLDSTKKALQQLIKLYKEKDINKLQQLTTEDNDFGSYDKIMIEKRNAKWLTAIAEQARQVPTFFAVGAGHLGGDNGIINLLRKKGFIVKPVFY